MDTSSIITLVIYAFLGMAASLKCPDYSNNDPGMPELIYYSDVVFRGVVSGMMDGDHQGDYTVTVKPQCVVKGQVPSEITIKHAGEKRFLFFLLFNF